MAKNMIFLLISEVFILLLLTNLETLLSWLSLSRSETHWFDCVLVLLVVFSYSSALLRLCGSAERAPFI